MEHAPKSRVLGILATLLLFSHAPWSMAQGPGLWMEYRKVGDPALLEAYGEHLQAVHLEGYSPTLGVIKAELERGLGTLLGRSPKFTPPGQGTHALWVS